MIEIYYNSSSLLLTSRIPNNLNIPSSPYYYYYYWEGITNLIISASAYDTVDSGSTNFGVTVGKLSLNAYSGSSLITSFPIETTTIYNDGFPSEIFPSSSITSSYLSSLAWTFNIFNPFYDSSSFSIYNQTLSSSFFTTITTGSGYFSNIITNNTYSLLLSGSGSGYTSYIYLNNLTSGSIIYALSASDNYISASFNPLAFNDYEVTFSITYLT